jgi:hypothetical protein
MAAWLTHIANTMHADHLAQDTRAAESSRKKTFCDKYVERIADSVLLLTGAPDDYFMHAYYQKLGGCQRGDLKEWYYSGRSTKATKPLESRPSRSCHSKALHLRLKTLDFYGFSLGGIGTGILPFSIIPPDATSASAVHDTAGLAAVTVVLLQVEKLDFSWCMC